jgi:Domain of unknown function (DUF4276)
MSLSITFIVEGPGDMQAVPTLARKILSEHGVFNCKFNLNRRGDLPKVKNKFNKFYPVAINDNAPVFCVLDFDCDFCNDVLQEENLFREMAHRIRPDWLFEVCFFVKEFETLFLCDYNSTKKVLKAIAKTWKPAKNSEAYRDAKGELSRAMPSDKSYNTTSQQDSVTAQLDLSYLRAHSPSFMRFEQALLRLTGLSV